MQLTEKELDLIQAIKKFDTTPYSTLECSMREVQSLLLKLYGILMNPVTNKIMINAINGNFAFNRQDISHVGQLTHVSPNSIYLNVVVTHRSFEIKLHPDEAETIRTLLINEMNIHCINILSHPFAQEMLNTGDK